MVFTAPDPEILDRNVARLENGNFRSHKKRMFLNDPFGLANFYQRLYYIQ